MTKPLLHQKAISLRTHGHSINFIAETLSVSKGTVSHWCKDISLSEKQLDLIARRSKHKATLSLLKASERQRMQRKAAIELATNHGKNDVGHISKRDMHMIGLGLYWGEGYKSGNQELGFTNSDPEMIVFYINWLCTIYKVSKKDLTLRVSINDQHAKRISQVHSYWSKATGIPQSQFTKISLIKNQSKKVYENLNTHFGTLRVKVRRGTEIRRRILGSISAIKIK